MKLLSLSFLLLCALVLASLPARANGTRDTCHQAKALAQMTVLQSGISFKPNTEELNKNLATMDVDEFCEFMYDAMEDKYGKKQVIEMAQYNYFDTVPFERFQTEEAFEKDTIFSCFGDQFDMDDLKPPTPEEVRRKVKDANKKAPTWTRTFPEE